MTVKPKETQTPPQGEEQDPQGTPPEGEENEGDGTEGLSPEDLVKLNQKANREAKALRERLKAAEAEAERLRKEAMSEQERAIAEAREEAAAEIRAEYEAKLLERSVRAIASTRLNDPEDAWRLIDFEDVDAEDEKAIEKAIDDLVKAKPYLARKRGGNGIDQGPHGSTPAGGSGGNDWLRSVTSGRR